MTKNADRVLRFLDSATSPMAVADVARALRRSCDLATVYRVLHRLETRGLVESFAFDCQKRGVERYWQRRRSAHRHFFHCESCHRFVDIGACRLERLSAEVQRGLGVEIQSHTLYYTGICSDCRSSKTNGDAAR